MSNDSKKDNGKKPYQFGGIKDFNLEEIENEVLNDSVYLDVFAGSDLNFKEDIKPLQNPLETILNLEAVSYKYKTGEFSEKNFPQGQQHGFIAQDLEKHVPVAVTTDGEGMKYVNYNYLAPLLVESVKSLTETIKKQEEEIQELKNLLKK